MIAVYAYRKRRRRRWSVGAWRRGSGDSQSTCPEGRWVRRRRRKLKPSPRRATGDVSRSKKEKSNMDTAARIGKLGIGGRGGKNEYLGPSLISCRLVCMLPPWLLLSLSLRSDVLCAMHAMHKREREKRNEKGAQHLAYTQQQLALGLLNVQLSDACAAPADRTMGYKLALSCGVV